MAVIINTDGSFDPIDTPLTLASIRRTVGHEFLFLDLLSGDILIHSINQNTTNPNNQAATKMCVSKHQVHGRAILCNDSEIA